RELFKLMVKIRTCTFCGTDIEPGTGTMYVRKDGSVLFFCTGRCHKARLKLKRNPRKLKWTKFYQKGK
ncbi:MAG TPA: 50S ribosomal protein L24e, partial [Candidatus Deferrimicrobium sp.]|nr:50S ribosomal protein L24e [Candidatus Deferrimicrobium sp.]